MTLLTMKNAALAADYAVQLGAFLRAGQAVAKDGAPKTTFSDFAAVQGG